MIFQSKYNNASYVIKPTRRVFDGSAGISFLVPGLEARFTGGQRLFNSEMAQEDLGWSDEDRELVEKKLLGHRDFGHTLFLAYGESVPESHKESVSKRAPVMPDRRCAFIVVDKKANTYTQCETPATAGRDYCQEHDPDTARIQRGMLST